MIETKIRTTCKTITWRTYCSIVGFITAYVLTGNWWISSSIALSQLVINTILYFIFDRIWSTINWHRIEGIETYTRSIVKTAVWRVVMFTTATSITYYFTGNLSTSGKFATAQLIINSILNVIHERIWNRVYWGKVDK